MGRRPATRTRLLAGSGFRHRQEPAQERARIILGWLVPLGIEKGKPFAPEARQAAILTEAAKVGEVMARTIRWAPNISRSMLLRLTTR
jgi:hypothetical protein